MSQTKAELLDPKGNITFEEITETVYTLGTTGSIALDPANGSIQSSVLTSTTRIPLGNYLAREALIREVWGDFSPPLYSSRRIVGRSLNF